MYPDPTIRLRIPTINSVIIINKYNKSRVHNSTKDPKTIITNLLLLIQLISRLRILTYIGSGSSNKKKHHFDIIIHTNNNSAPDPHKNSAPDPHKAQLQILIKRFGSDPS